ncbi:hypothetical protein XCR_4349 [Xanthomonas campestris pv. raphani 756C]|nr:hypothetical protein XCR_4349 [Xanthomonas campestris pv. raphani 756C]
MGPGLDWLRLPLAACRLPARPPSCRRSAMDAAGAWESGA